MEGGQGTASRRDLGLGHVPHLFEAFLDDGGGISVGREEELIDKLRDTCNNRANTVGEELDDRSEDFVKIHE